MESERELLNAARAMDKEALVKIFDLYSQPLYRYALRLCGDSLLADHIVGDVFAKLLDQFAAGHGPSTALRSYLYETAYHRTIDEARSARRKASLEIAEWLPLDSPAGHGGLEDQVLFKQILSAIQNHLTEDQRHVLVLHFLEGFPLGETAAIIGKKADHVRVIQSRALTKLRKVLASQGSRLSMPLPATGEQPKSIRI